MCLCNQVFRQPWPGMMRTVYGNHERFETTYFKKFPGYYTTGDGEYGILFCCCVCDCVSVNVLFIPASVVSYVDHLALSLLTEQHYDFSRRLRLKRLVIGAAEGIAWVYYPQFHLHFICDLHSGTAVDVALFSTVGTVIA